MAGLLDPDEGRVTMRCDLRIRFLDHVDVLDPTLTVGGTVDRRF